MQPLELSIVDQDGCTRKQWTFAGDLAVIAAKIEAMIRESAVPAKPAAIYTLAIRSESFGTLFVDGLNRSGPRIDDRGRALCWFKPSWAWAWWQRNKGDDTRPVEVVHAITGERVEVSESAEAWGRASRETLDEIAELRRQLGVSQRDLYLARKDAYTPAYTLAIRAEVWRTLYIDHRNPFGPRVDNLRRALHWSEPAAAWTWWQLYKGDDTRLVEVVQAITGKRVEVSEPADAEGGAA